MIFFKNICNEQESPVIPDHALSLNDLKLLSDLKLNEDINCPITGDEILKCVKMLKCNKACGEDRIYNEYIKNTVHIVLPFYVELFNWIFDNGIYLTKWLIGNIIPIYKNKGDEDDPKNYRPITLISCLSKLFTSVLNERLNTFSEKN